MFYVIVLNGCLDYIVTLFLGSACVRQSPEKQIGTEIEHRRNALILNKFYKSIMRKNMEIILLLIFIIKNQSDHSLNSVV